MSNDGYLILVYFSAFFGSLALAVYVNAALREKFATLARDLLSSKPANAFGRIFPVSIWLTVLLGFSTVSMKSCTKDKYTGIVANKEYLLGKAQEQISSASWYLVWALCLWALAITVILIVRAKQHEAG